MSERPIEYGTIVLDGTPFPCVPDVGYQNLAQFARKVVSGDPGRDSDDLISSKIWTGFPGGIGVLNNKDVADDGKCWYSTVWSRDPFTMTLNRRVVQAAASPAVQYPLGDLAGTYYAATTTTVHAWNEGTDAFGSALTNTLGAAPVGRAVAWQGKLYIPCGASGYHTSTSSAVSTPIDATVKAVAFVAATDPQVPRLFALTSDGYLKSTFDGTTWTTDATLNSSETPRRLFVWMDRTETDTIFVVTDRSVYAFDPVSSVLVRTRLSEMPPHPDNGLGAGVWRPGEDAYVSFGLQVMQYAAGLSQIAPVGPDRQEGLPDELRGRIVDLCPEFNSLVALLDGVAVASSTPASEFDPGHEDEPTEIAATQAVSAVLAYNGFGWHPLWQSGASGTSTWLCVSGASSAYRLWWGFGGGLYTIALPRSFANPRQEFRTGEGSFEASGQLDLGWYDGNMREFEKLASHVEVNLDSGSATETVAVEYDTDWDADWRTLGTASATGKTVLPFAVSATTEGTSFSTGLAFRRIRFRLTFARDPADATQTPVLDSFVLKHLRLPLSGQSYTVTIPLQVGPEGWGGRTAGQIKEELEALLTKQGFVRLQHGDHPDHRSHRVRIAYVNGGDRTGLDDRGYRTINLVAVPLEGFEG